MEFSRSEHRAILTLGLIAGFVIAFASVVTYDSGVIHINYTTGLATMLLCVIGMAFSIYLHEWTHKWIAGLIGYYTHVTAYMAGQLFGVALAVFSFGFLQFFTPNTCDLEANPAARIHKHRKYENFRQEAFIAGSGVAATAILAILLHGAYILTGAPLLNLLMMGNVWLMVYSLIPFELLQLYELRFFNKIDKLPQSDGLYLLHYSIYSYVFAGTTALALAVILTFTTSASLWLVLMFGIFAFLFVWYKFFQMD